MARVPFEALQAIPESEIHIESKRNCYRVIVQSELQVSKFVAKALNQIETQGVRRVRFEYKEVDTALVDECETLLQKEV